MLINYMEIPFKYDVNEVLLFSLLNQIYKID